MSMINQENMLDYIRRAKQGDERAKNYIFITNSPLIKSIIRRFKNKGIEYDDLYQIASVGFIKALNNYDESFGVKFSTYTVPMIIGEIKRYIRDNGAIKVSRSLKSLANKINRFVDDYQTSNVNSPSIELISNKFEITAEEVVLALESTKMPLSIYDKIDDDEDGQELIEKIVYEDTEEKNITKIHLASIIDDLSDREKMIVTLRYFRDKTQSEVAKTLGVSQVQISRLENKILQKIRLKY